MEGAVFIFLIIKICGIIYKSREEGGKIMAEINKVNNFAMTWLNKFRDPTISYKKLVSHNWRGML